MELTPKACLKSFRFDLARCNYLGFTENSQNTQISISRGLYVVPELSVPSTESVRRTLMFVLATHEVNFGFAAFVLENTNFFGNLPKSGPISDKTKTFYGRKG